MWHNPSARLIALLPLIHLLCVASLRSEQASGDVPSRIGRIDESARLTLRGNRHPLAIAAHDRGAVAPELPMERMLLVLKRDPEAQRALDKLLAEQQDKSSPNFHAWLSPEAFRAGFAPSEADRQKLAAWLESHGFRVNGISRGGMAIEFSGTAQQVGNAFHAPIHHYVVREESHFANAEDPEIPAALAPVVAGVSTLHDFEKRPTIRLLGSADRIANTSGWVPNFTYSGYYGTFHYLAPGDFAKIYNLGPLYQDGIDGSGQSIAIVARSSINRSDLQDFRMVFGLPASEPEIIFNGPSPGNTFGGDETEATFSAEWAGALAPKAAIQLVVSASTNTTDGVDLSAQYIVDNNLAPVMSITYGACEFLLGEAERQFFNHLWEQAAAEGITVVAASGDSGAAGCDIPWWAPATQGPGVNGVASTPFNVAVGGSEFQENGAESNYWAESNGPDQSSALGYIPEAAWNESCAEASPCGYPSLYASGGGASSSYAKPSWQAGPGVPNDGRRDIPDVSLAAAGEHDGYLLCQNGACITDDQGQLISAYVIGGTSAAAPAFAAIMALVNQKLQSRQGQANFVLYPLAAAGNPANCNASGNPQSSCTFDDITEGNNTVPGQSGYAAGPGYDMATGLGSANAARLVNGWSNVTFRPTSAALAASPAAGTHGQPVNVSVTVTPASGTGTPSGDVVLLAGGKTVDLGSLTNGSISAPVTTLPGGSYTLTASYGGDGTFGASTSNSVPITISPEASQTSFTTLGYDENYNLVPQTATTYGAYFYFRADVAGVSGQGIASGTLTFTDTFNAVTTTLPPVALNSQGNVLVPETSLAVGTHVLAVEYSGNASFTASTAGPVTIAVGKGLTYTYSYVPSGALPNSPITLYAFVFSNGVAAPTGNVQFYSGASALESPVKLEGYFAQLTIPQLPVGQYSIKAVYTGDANFNPSTSDTNVLIVANPDFQIAVNPGLVTVTATTPGQATLWLTPGPGVGFSGMVSFTCSGLPAGTTCSMLPGTLTLDGYTTATATVTISRSAAAASAGFEPRRHGGVRLAGFLAAMGALFLARPRRKRLAEACRVFALAGLLAWNLSCGGGGVVRTTPPPDPVGNTYAVKVTASGDSGFSIVSHSVTLAARFQ